MRNFHTVTAGVILLLGSNVYAQNRSNQVETNKKIVHDFYRFVWEPADDSALMKWLPEKYVEHNPRFRNGSADLASFLRTRRKGQPVKVSDTLHDPPELIMAEGDLVTWIFKRMRKDPQDPSQQYESFWFDTFRVKDGKIVEHWDGALRDELQFQIVHQVEELWMKLIAYTLLDIDEYMAARNTNRVLTLFKRVHITQRLMIEELSLLETMSPKEYQTIRLGLGAGSGQESPGFRALLATPPFLWETYKQHYLDAHSLTVEAVYDTAYDHVDAYVVAEQLVEFDELFQDFRFHHMQLIRRSIGIDAKSLKGRPVEILESGQRHSFFPELWAVRGNMTDAWGAQYGRKRESLGGKEPGHH